MTSPYRSKSRTRVVKSVHELMVELILPTTLRATARIAVWSFQEWVNNKIPAGVNWWCLGIERSSRQSQGCQGEWDRGHSQIANTPTGKDTSILNLTMHGMIDLLNAGTCYWDHSALSSSQSLFLPSRFDGTPKKNCFWRLMKVLSQFCM